MILTDAVKTLLEIFMEDHRLKAFCLAIEMKSFSKAAEAKFMTQSAISHLVKKLEDELGVRLFIRKGKTVIPTPAGKLLYDHAKRILEQFTKMEDDLYALMQRVKGTLSIGADITAATYLLPQVFYSFSKDYPEVKVDLSVSSAETIMNGLREGKTEIGIFAGAIKKSSVFAEEIAEDEIVIIASDDNPLAERKTLASQDLVSQPFIMPEAGSGLRELIDGFLLRIGMDPERIKVSMTLGNPELIVQMVQSGIGISLVSKWSVFRAIKDGSVKLLNVPGKKLRRKFYLVSLEKESSTLVAAKFRDFIKGYRFFVPL
jgi:DNA-binding transcriptional LysR family regulator